MKFPSPCPLPDTYTDARRAWISRIGGWPKNRLYSRLNWLGLSYPTPKAALAASSSSGTLFCGAAVLGFPPTGHAPACGRRWRKQYLIGMKNVADHPHIEFEEERKVWPLDTGRADTAKDRKSDRGQQKPGFPQYIAFPAQANAFLPLWK